MTNSDNHMKIMIDVTPLMNTKTGIGYYTERLLTALADGVPEGVEIVGFYYNFLGRRDASHLPKAKNIRYTKMSLIPSKLVYQLRRWGIEFPIELFTLEKADFILYPNFLDHPSLFGTPGAPVIHDMTYLDLPQYVAPKLRRDLTRFVPRAMKRSAFVITVSDFSKQGIIKNYGIAADRILVTHIPAQPHAQMEKDKKQFELKSLGITKPFLLFVGTIDPRKNIIGLIDGYTRLPQNLRDKYSLVVAGRIELLAKAEVAKFKEAKKQGYDVIHLGYVTDQAKDALYQSASLFVSASKYEGFGMPLVEAMSYGIPCAASNIPVFTEIGADAAAYFDPSKPDDIALVIKQLLENPAKARELAEDGRKHAAGYSWKAVAAEVFERITAAVTKD